jgi:radical SAM protein with 4Fe4S-binding SPASM domain
MGTQAQPYRLGEYHSFSAAGTEFLYLVPSGSIFAVEGVAKLVIELLGSGEMPREALVAKLIELGCSREEVENTLQELTEVDAVQCDLHEKEPLSVPVQEFPLQRIVLNTTNQCNLACTYCYEYSEDKIAQSAGKEKFMSKEIAEASVEMLIKESAHRPNLHVTFFGGETLLNFAVMRSTVEYARRRGEEVGFQAVGFAPATASPQRLYHIGGQKMDSILDQFGELATEYCGYALRNIQHGFTNASDTLKELHTGISKAYACGAGLGMLGVGTEGNIGLCHRFVDSPIGKMGSLKEGGINKATRREFLNTHHVGARYDCHTCWARPVCAGGCYHEAYINQGSTNAANLHHCDWIRGWNDVCLKVYGEIAVQNPEFLNRFAEN